MDALWAGGLRRRWVRVERWWDAAAARVGNQRVRVELSLSPELRWGCAERSPCVELGIALQADLGLQLPVVQEGRLKHFGELRKLLVEITIAVCEDLLLIWTVSTIMNLPDHLQPISGSSVQRLLFDHVN